MTLLLTLEQGPRSQAVRQARLDEGELVIGRSPEADWQIDDPDMFVSRAHCKITAEQDGYFVTDMSSSGLFIDDTGSPLGAGNSTRLKSGMRLRLGDYVLWVDLQGTGEREPEPFRQPAPPASRAPVSFGGDDFFSVRTEEEPRRPRPADLPDPFEQPKPGAFQAFENTGGKGDSPAFDDPFSLDPVATPAPNGGVEDHPRGRAAFDDAAAFDALAPQPDARAGQRAQPPAFGSPFEGFDPGPVRTPARYNGAGASGGPENAHVAAPSPEPWDLPPPPAQAPAPRPHVARRPEPQRPAAGVPTDTALRAAFLRGVGMDDSDSAGRDPVAEMEKFGREYRLMMEGLMQLLRKRAEEKSNARVAQTVVGASEVNPLKFLPTVDDALATIFAERSPGFLAGEPAIADAVRDLAQHHVRAWRGVQGALRRMIDRFDPAAIEEELKSSSAIGTLLSGGRGAKLWELYQKRHHEIAQSAETRFLGEIGADFRDAYEEE
jgi:type VI secretion system protein ImpI